MTAIRTWIVAIGLSLSLVQPRERSASGSVARPAGPGMIGLASWYGWQHNGRLMANGRPFRPLALTAASRVLPLGSRIRVTNLDNGRSAELLVTDRGPYVHGRIIDISLGAAKQLRMVALGLARVRIERLGGIARRRV